MCRYVSGASCISQGIESRTKMKMKIKARNKRKKRKICMKMKVKQNMENRISTKFRDDIMLMRYSNASRQAPDKRQLSCLVTIYHFFFLSLLYIRSAEKSLFTLLRSITYIWFQLTHSGRTARRENKEWKMKMNLKNVIYVHSLF